MVLKGRDEAGGVERVYKEGADGAPGWMVGDGDFNRGCWGLGANKHSHNANVTAGPCFNSGFFNLTPVTLVFSST